MGVEHRGTVTVGGKKVPLKGDFASDHVTLSGGRRGELAYKQLKILSTAKGVLKLEADGLVLEFPVGSNVDRLANKIRSPPTLMDKLGVKEGMRVMCEHVPAGLLKQVSAAAGPARGAAQYDLVLFGIAGRDELEGLEAQASRVAPDGGLWVVYPKGRRDIRESDVLAAGRAIGLKDVKVARISEKHTALKFVVPLADRPG